MTLFGKNDPLKGGSFYVQSKVFCAKEFLMSQYPGEEEKYMKQHEEDLKKADGEKTEKTEKAEGEGEKTEKTEKAEEPKNDKK